MCCCDAQGQYSSPADFTKLNERMSLIEGPYCANRMFYLSIPPSVFIDAAGNSADFCSTRLQSDWLYNIPVGPKDCASDRLLRVAIHWMRNADFELRDALWL